MRIAYAVNARIPTEKAHGYQIMRFLSSLASLDHEVTLYVPNRDNSIDTDAFSFYGLPPVFSVRYLRGPRLLRFVRLLGPVAFIADSLFFAYALHKEPSLERETPVITRDPVIAWVLGRLGRHVFYNAHAWSKHRQLLRFLLSNVSGVVANSSGTARDTSLHTKAPVLTCPNASDPNPYLVSNKNFLRQSLGIPLDAFVCLYTGHLYTWKGIDTFVQAASLMNDPSMLWLVVGGLESDVERYRALTKETSSLHFAGYRPKEDIAKYLRAADALILPNSACSVESREYTSPLKLFEYLTSGTPIIASDLPSIRKVVSERSVLFANPDDAESFAQQVTEMRKNPTEALNLAKEGLCISAKATWEARANDVVGFIQHTLR